MSENRQGTVLAMVFLAEYHILWNLLYPYLWKLPYQQFELVFAICLIVAVGVHTVKHYINNYGNLMLVAEHIKKESTFEQVFIVALFIWFAVDCVLQQFIDGVNYIQNNEWKLFCLALAAFVFFPFVKITGDKKSRIIIERMIHFAVIIYTLFWIWVLWQYFNMEYVTFPSGNHLYMADDRWLQAGINRNNTAAHAAVMLSLSIYMIVTQGIKTKALYLLVAIVHTTVVMLTGSRTSYIAIVCTICISISIAICKRFENNLGIVKKIVLSGIITVLCVFILGWIKKGIYIILLYCMQIKLGKTIPLSTVIRPFNDLSGRKAIWISTIKMLFSNPKRFFIGVLPSQIGTTLVNMGLRKKTIPHCHNVLLEVGASLGVPTMLLYICFLYFIISRCIHMMHMNNQQNEIVSGICIVIMCALIIDIAESFLFGPISVNMPIFYMFAGWITVLDENYKDGEILQLTDDY